MDISKTRIDNLVEHPSESLNVEIKTWIDLSSEHGLAKLVRAAIALRNRNGGYFIVGFDDKTLLPDTSTRPTDVRTAFHIDKIQATVSRFASIPFEIEIGYANRDGHEYPVIAVPSGVTVPVASKSDLQNPSDAKRLLLRRGDVYFRTLNSSGIASTSAARPEDWAEIISICFENREGDIGRFLRRQLADDGLVRFIAAAQGVLASNVPPPTTLDRAHAILTSGKQFLKEALVDRGDLTAAQKKLTELGSYSTAMVVNPARNVSDSDQAFFNTISSSNPNYTGWPVWLDSRGFRDQKCAPYKNRKGWQALIIAEHSSFPHFDFYRIDAKGEFFLHRVLQDDVSEKVPAGAFLDPIIVILRVAEIIAVGIAFARALGSPDDAMLGFCFEWNGLRGRELEAWGNAGAYFSPGRKAYDDSVLTCVEIPMTTPLPAIAPYVGQAISDLFSAFDGFVISNPVVETWVDKLLTRRL
ncbi:hypothetical protein BV511_06565 [Methylorubrum extorquens]|uniref:hypothetical protein n=1 Tax=Methylorubrum extorquens TaxID=408 RepID=UPI000972AA2D|nr:hypothetical protein [Methylorubrum extorquens]APX84412.1 hypothetical protein BV511_06565 [Methylorubrum extorquens]